jgi:hypothetical protein
MKHALFMQGLVLVCSLPLFLSGTGPGAMETMQGQRLGCKKQRPELIMLLQLRGGATESLASGTFKFDQALQQDADAQDDDTNSLDEFKKNAFPAGSEEDDSGKPPKNAEDDDDNWVGAFFCCMRQ